MTDGPEDADVSPSPRSAVLVLRVWVEGEPSCLRARLVEVEETRGEQSVVTAAGTVDEVAAAIRRWLEEFFAA